MLTRWRGEIMSRSSSRAPALSPRDQIQILLEEFRALYGLAEHRIAALERRVPILGAALTGFVASVAVMPALFQLGLALSMPIALVWFVQTTVNHARSLEDLFRRIEEIEQGVNSLAGADLLGFQSSHPSRGKAIGGRIGTGTALTVTAGAILLMAACFYLVMATDELGKAARLWTLGYVGLSSAGILALLVSLRRYRYRRQP